MSVTIKTIAQHAGVTHSTVSRALRGDPRVRADTTERIKAIAVELGYTPSRMGRGLRTNRTYALGLVVSHMTDPFLTEVVRGVQDKLLPANYSVYVAATNVDAEREAAIVRSFREHQVDGILVCSSRFAALYRTLIDQQTLPVVLINHQGEGQYAYSVAHDDRRAAATVVRYLIDLGHQRVAYVGNVRGGSANANRLAGYHDALRSAGLPFDPQRVAFAESGRITAGTAAVAAWVHLPPTARPSAIFCYNDLLAISVLHAFRAAGVHVPRDLSIVGFDDIEIAAYMDPPLTTFAQPKHQLGTEAADMMLHLLDQTLTTHAARVLYGDLVVRGSTGRPASPEAVI